MSSRQAGFTLLELLVSVSLLVLLMALLFTGLDAGTRHIGRQSERVDRVSRLVMAQSFMRAQLADARALSPSDSPGGAIDFDGRADGVDFVSGAPQAVAQGGLQVLSLDIVDSHSGEQLLVGWRPFRGGGDTSASGAIESGYRTALLDHIHEAAFAYFGALEGETTPSWHPTWQNVNYLPSLVRLSVTFLDGEQMPEFVVALRGSSGATGIPVDAVPQ